MKVPFIDLTSVTEKIKARYLEKVKSLLEKRSFILSEEVEEFEKSWAKYVGVKYAVGVSSGADALYLSLVACGISEGDEVITQGNAYNASVVAILRTGAVPRFVDIKEETLQIDPEKVEALINKKTKAILPIHLYGQSGDILKICEIAKKHKLLVIEDCAQAHGATFSGKKLGTFGKVSAFSFYPTKNLGAFGDAGAVVTDNGEIYEEVLMRRNLGQKTKNDHQVFGSNMRLDPIQAIALSLKLEFLDDVNKSRQQAAEYYDKLISESGVKVEPVAMTPGAMNIYHLYVVKIKGERGAVQKKLTDAGIETSIHYPAPVYNQPFYKGLKDFCPVTEETCERILSLPMFYGITKQQQEFVVQALKKV